MSVLHPNKLDNAMVYDSKDGDLGAMLSIVQEDLDALRCQWTCR